MKNILGFDPNKFTHEKSDDKSTTLRHKDGHTITIAHNVLSPENREMLKALSGPKKDGYGKILQKASGGMVKEIHPDESEYGYTKRKKMAAGGPTDSYSMGLPCLNPNCKSHGRPHPNCRCYGMANGGKVSDVHYCAYGKPHMAGCEYAQGGEVDSHAYLIKPQEAAVNPSGATYNQSTSGTTGKGRNQINKASSEVIAPQQSAPAEPEEDMSGYQDYPTHFQRGMAKGGPVPSNNPGMMSSRQGFPNGGPVEKDENGGIRGPMTDPGLGSKVMSGLHALGDWLQNSSAGQLPTGSSKPQPQSQTQASDQPAPDNMSQGPATPPGITPEQNQIDENQNEDMTGGMSQGPATPPSVAAPPAAASNPDMGPATLQHPALANPQQYQQAVKNNIMDEARAWSQDLSDGHIEPETYQSLFDKKDTLGKIGTLFGMMLSGAGSGLAHQPNMLMEMMNKEIDRDLDAQKTSSTNRQNYIKLAQAHDLNKANILATQAGARLTDAQTAQIRQEAGIKARIFAQRGAMAKIFNDINNMPEGQAKQQALNAGALLYQKMDATNADAATMYGAAKALQQFGGQGYGGPGSEQAFQQGTQALQMGGQGDLARDMQEHHFAGIPQRTSIPIESGDRAQVTAMQNVNDLFNRSLLYARQPVPKNPADLIKYKAAANALHGSLIGAIKQAQHDGVYKPSEAEFILGQIGDSPGSVFAAYNAVPKIKEIQAEKQNEYNNLLAKYGVNPQQMQGQVPSPGPQLQMGSKTKRPMYQDAQGQWRYKSK